MQFEVFRPLTEMSLEDIIEEYKSVTKKHRQLKLGVRDGHRWMQKYSLGPANLYHHMESLAERIHYGNRKFEIQQYFNSSYDKLRKEANLNPCSCPKEYRRAVIRKENQETAKTGKVELKLRLATFRNIPQIWEGKSETLRELAGTAHVDFPLGWGKPKGQPDTPIRPFSEHIRLPPIQEWATHLEPKEVKDD